mmetsp:Transcript_23764/g.50527  ORF Transcript_23764/g.50527 Transcript_23764/m.50527 type:complete len:598 (+) Transcript_23764:125-1918(+)
MRRLGATLLHEGLFRHCTALSSTAPAVERGARLPLQEIRWSPWHRRNDSITGADRKKPFSTKSAADGGAKKPQGKIAIAMSGGVDSSVVAYLLSQSHHASELIGVHMSNWDYADENPTAETTRKSNKNNSYCWEQDWKDATAVAEQLKIPINHVSFQAEYWNEVFQPYCQKLSQSITPNPDVDCNRYIKFGALKDYLEKRFDGDIDYLATGHYARIWDRSNSHSSTRMVGGTQATTIGMPECLEQALEEEESAVLADYILHSSLADAPLLLSARDRSKDQSYFLSGVSAEAFSGVLLPLGDLYKTEQQGTKDPADAVEYKKDNGGNDVLSVRQVAQKAKLPNATKRDSVGICFIGKRKHGDFINEYVDHPLDNPGSSGYVGNSSLGPTSSLVECINIENNDVVATFDPVENPFLVYATVGQGAKISGAGQKWFVVNKELQPPPPHRNNGTSKSGSVPWKSPRVFVCPGTHHPSLYADSFCVRRRNFNWIAGGGGNNPPPLPFQAKCRIRHLQPLVDCEIVADDDNDCFEIRLKLPLRGVAPGQVCVVYAGGIVGDLVCLGGGPIEQAGQNYWEMERDLPAVLHSSGHNDLTGNRNAV